MFYAQMSTCHQYEHWIFLTTAVIPKQFVPSVEQVEPYSLIPQWAIAVIVIGMASLLFVIVFGVAVVSLIVYV